jgi:hypothetical protein
MGSDLGTISFYVHVPLYYHVICTKTTAHTPLHIDSGWKPGHLFPWTRPQWRAEIDTPLSISDFSYS